MLSITNTHHLENSGTCPDRRELLTALLSSETHEPYRIGVAMHIVLEESPTSAR